MVFCQCFIKNKHDSEQIINMPKCHCSDIALTSYTLYFWKGCRACNFHIWRKLLSLIQCLEMSSWSYVRGRFSSHPALFHYKYYICSESISDLFTCCFNAGPNRTSLLGDLSTRVVQIFYLTVSFSTLVQMGELEGIGQVEKLLEITKDSPLGAWPCQTQSNVEKYKHLNTTVSISMHSYYIHMEGNPGTTYLKLPSKTDL